MDHMYEQNTSIRSERMKLPATPTRLTASTGLHNEGETVREKRDLNKTKDRQRETTC